MVTFGNVISLVKYALIKLTHMKKILLSILSVITIGAFTQETNIVNNGF